MSAECTLEVQARDLKACIKNLLTLLTLSRDYTLKFIFERI